jgi:hypothetical protein
LPVSRRYPIWSSGELAGHSQAATNSILCAIGTRFATGLDLTFDACRQMLNSTVQDAHLSELSSEVSIVRN